MTRSSDNSSSFPLRFQASARLGTLVALLGLGAAAVGMACSSSNGDNSGGNGGTNGQEGGAGGDGGTGGTGGDGGTSGDGGTGGTSGDGGTGGAGGDGTAGMTSGGAGGMTSGGAGGMTSGGAGGAATPTAAFVYVSGFTGGNDAVRAFELNLANGSLAARGMGAVDFAPGYGAIRPNGRHIYFLQEVYSNLSLEIVSFAINPANGMLTPGPQRNNNATQNVHLFAHPSGNWLLMASFGTDTVKVFPINENGSLGAQSDSQVPPGSDPNPHQVITDPAGRFVFAPCINIDKVTVWEMNQTTGALTFRQQIDLSDGPRHMAFHPSAKWAYVLTEFDADVVSYNYNAQTGALTMPMRYETRPGENWAAHIVVSPNGKFVFASARRQPRLFVYTVNEQTGQLTLVQTFADADLSTPRNFSIDPTGKYLVVASQGSARIFVAEINQTSGMLTKVGNAVMVADQPTYVGIVAKP